MKFPDRGPGPWDDEPSEVNFEASGLKCVLRRGPMGAWCGYVGIPNFHPLFGHDYNEECEALNDLCNRVMKGPVGKRGVVPLFCAGLRDGKAIARPDLVFDVHGSITYASDRPGGASSKSDLWWFGFDCSHAGDLSPKLPTFGDEQYRTVQYARSETESLAGQLASVSDVLSKAVEQ